MKLIKLTGFVTGLMGMEEYAITAYPVVSLENKNYITNRPDWELSSLKPVTQDDEQYIYCLPPNLNITIAEKQEVWLIGPKLIKKLHKVASVLPDINTTIDFIDSWGSYKEYQISTGTFDQLSEFFKPIKKAMVTEVKKQLTTPEEHDVNVIKTMFELADTLPTSKKTLEDYICYAAFCKYTLNNYEYDFTMNWAILETELHKEANPEKSFNELVLKYFKPF